MNNLVYVQFNAKILNKKKRAKEKVDLLVASDASMAQGWIVEGGDEDDDGSDLTWTLIGEASGADQVLEPRRSERNVVVRELDDEVDEEMEDKIDDEEDAYNYESDGDRILEEYGFEYVGDDEELET